MSLPVVDDEKATIVSERLPAMQHVEVRGDRMDDSACNLRQRFDCRLACLQLAIFVQIAIGSVSMAYKQSTSRINASKIHKLTVRTCRAAYYFVGEA